MKNVAVLAKAPGKTMMLLKSGSAEQNVDIKVEQYIETIQADITNLEVEQGKEESILLTINPVNATEELKFTTKDPNIAIVRQDSANKNLYKVYGNSAGTTEIIFSAKNTSQTVPVKVTKQETPEIKSITVENSENKKKYKAGEEMIIRVEFDDIVKGTVPEISLKFGNHYSINKAECINGIEQDTIIRYKYIVADGDNGELMVEKLQGGNLTDSTGEIKAITVLENDKYYPTLDRLYKLGSSANDNDEELETKSYINNGVYQNTGVEADTQVEDITLESAVDKDSNWLKNGDVIKVKISTEKLKEKPTVTFNGIEAQVEGEGDTYTASMPVTENLADGYVEVKVDNIIDEMGNTKEAVVAKQSGIEEPIIIDNSAPIISSINIMKKQGEEVKTGESFDIVVNFKDTANVTKEYITSESTPGLKLKIGGKDAKGTLTSEYKPGEYVQAIKYTYTVSAEDKGEVTVDGMTGIVTDVAGNSSDLVMLDIKSNTSEKKEDNNPTTPVDISKTTNTTKTPTTGDKIAMSAAILLTVILTAVIVELLYRRNKRDI